MATLPTPTNGLNTIASIDAGIQTITLLLGERLSYQLNPVLQDLCGTQQSQIGPFSFTRYEPGIATIDETGAITAVSVGQTTVEVSYPAYGNACGDITSDTGAPTDGLPLVKIYAEVVVSVTL
jgi:hypothetical protein